MTFALTKARLYGVTIDEPVRKRAIQRAYLKITAANTDTDMDLGDTGGTFWTAAVAADSTAANVRTALHALDTKAQSFLGVRGEELVDRFRDDGVNGFSIVAAGEFTTAGGDTDETIPVSGALATDIALVTLHTAGGTPRTVVDASASSDQIDVDMSDDPSTDHVLSYLLLRARPGTNYRVSIQNNLPNLTFQSGSGETEYNLVLEWELKDGELPTRLEWDTTA